MTKTHEPKKIFFCPINIEIDYDESQRIWFVFLETEPFDYEGKFPVKNPQTGKLEGKIETRKFSHLRFTFNSQKEINNFSSSVKKGHFYEVETSWSSGGKISRDNGINWVEQVNINEENPQIKKFSAGEKITPAVSRKPNDSIWILAIGGILILGVILGLFWWWKKRQRLSQKNKKIKNR